MTTYSQFREDVQFAHENMMLESKGFGDIAKKRREKKDKYQYLSPRSRKLKDLRDRPESWAGLESFDVFS